MSFKRFITISVAMIVPAFVLLANTQFNWVSAAVSSSTINKITAHSLSSTSTVTSTPLVSPTKTATRVSGATPIKTTLTATTQDKPGHYYVFVKPDSHTKTRGSVVTFSGSHFYPNESIIIRQGGVVIGSADADTMGDFTTGAFKVPYTSSTTTFTFTGKMSNIPFTVDVKTSDAQPWITLSSYYAGAGSEITIKGYSFGSYEPVSISFDGVTYGSVSADVEGNVTMKLIIPKGNTGERIIQAVGGRSTISATQTFSQAF